MNTIRVSETARIRTETIAADQHCVVIDDFFEQPRELVEFAARHVGEFSQQQSSYPGRMLRVDADAMVHVYQFLRNNMSRHFPFLRGKLDYWTYLSIVTAQAADLSCMQRMCHTDPEANPGRTPYAALVYLFDDEALGGTSFFRWKDPALVREAEAIASRSADEALAFLQDKFSTFREPPRYMTESNEIADLLCTIPPRFNRMVFYSGDIPHSGAITAPELLSTNVRRGRLTLNIYVSALPRFADSTAR